MTPTAGTYEKEKTTQKKLWKKAKKYKNIRSRFFQSIFFKNRSLDFLTSLFFSPRNRRYLLKTTNLSHLKQ